MSDQITAIVLAAGAGTRMKSSQAKVLHQIGGRALVDHALRAVAGVGASSTVAVVGHQREQVSAAINELAPQVKLAVQAEQRGTGHAVAMALDALDGAIDGAIEGTVLITYADVPLLTPETLGDLLGEHRAESRAVSILSANATDPTGYGRIVRDPNGAVVAIREHKDASEDELAIHEINSGILAVDAQFLVRAISGLDDQNAQGELYLTDIVAAAVDEGLPVGAHVLEDVWQTEGVNDRTQLAKLGRVLNERLVDHWMREGVTIVDPESTWIDSGVSIGPDTTILPNTQLLGATSVGSGATIGPDTTLRNLEVGDEATVIRTHASDSVIGAGASVGPFSYLRPGTVVAANAKVGAFVEIKNSNIGEGAKVPHLSYVGDADIGEGANIGAGTIFANYDGKNKHRSRIGRHAKTSSNNTFVAPVQVGDGAFTGAGATIRDDVPAGALGVSAGPQRNIEGWVARKRPGSASAEAAEQAAGQTDPSHGADHGE